MEECAEDFECGITHFCWYASKADRDVEQKRCIEMYSQENGATFGWMQKGEDATIDDHQHNGKYCKSGLAFEVSENQSQCTETTAIKFQDEVLDVPYECDPTDPFYKCQITWIAG